ncbi:glycine cleavage system protein GcvH [Haloarcula sp. CBA1130]|uniref:glycine cleavage system protein GcvH n=1 Tax=unclassified Haloarcula TaxID=2624677 RepID=UPI0012492E95|nr:MULTISPECIES: glycine cleavage system protein GcvH [unclassified Haloarcula]KAA9398206.1 glycine cleavage system protein GcvH [Haloarcula sp. CBA1129]KAA9402107.1 glycine cleavage system protein GcvH [Haloarcula sp. CBA1130]
MSFDVPDDLRYLESHEWVRISGDTAEIGITEFAQDELGDVVFVELPDEGAELTAGEDFGVVESIKAVSDVYAPVSGTVTAVNDQLRDEPELLNEDPFGDGWMLEVELDEESDIDDLLSPAAYRDQIE